MVAAIITAGAGLLGILLTVLSQWFGPRNERQLMALELELLAKVKELEPGDSIQRQLLEVIEGRAINWATYRSAPMLAVRYGGAVVLAGIVVGALEAYFEPAVQTRLDVGMILVGLTLVAIGVIPTVRTAWSLRRRAKTLTPRAKGNKIG